MVCRSLRTARETGRLCPSLPAKRSSALLSGTARISLAILFLVVVVTAAGCNNPELIRDLRDLPQDHFAYLPGVFGDLNRPLADRGWQEEKKGQYLQNLFLPWHQEMPQYTAREVQEAWLPFVPDPGDRSRPGRRRRSLIRKAAANAAMRSYPNSSWKGITTAAVQLRHLPTAAPVVSDSSRRVDKNHPLDKLQVSSVPPGTPVYVSHRSRDGRWLLVETGFVRGWTTRQGVAAVSPDFRQRWEQGPYAAIVRDKTPLAVSGGRFLYRVSPGALFPVASSRGETLKVFVPVRGTRGRAALRTAVVSGTAAAPLPLPLTPANLAAVANELIREPYGWGGMYGRRDCSAMIRDLFTPFGIWLPRHSADQAREGGHYVGLAGLSTADKKRLITDRGVPYLTLLWLRGHIMLYIGSRDGEPLVFHNFWSVRTMSASGRPGRKIVGRAAITTLYPGREFNAAADPEGPYLAYLQGMILLGPPADN